MNIFTRLKREVSQGLNFAKNYFKRDLHIGILEYAEKHPEGFTIGELCRNSKVDTEKCKKMRAELVHSGILTGTNEVREDVWGSEQRVYFLSFSGKQQLQSHRILKLTNSLYFLTSVLVGGLGIQIFIAIEQTDYARVQSMGDRIYQAQVLHRAIEHCVENPGSKESGVFFTEGPKTGQQATCDELDIELVE